MDNADMIEVMNLSSRILEIIENVDDFTQSDLQGAVEAVIMNAVNYGKKGAADDTETE